MKESVEQQRQLPPALRAAHKRRHVFHGRKEAHLMKQICLRFNDLGKLV